MESPNAIFNFFHVWGSLGSSISQHVAPFLLPMALLPRACTFCLSVQRRVDIWVALTFWPLWINSSRNISGFFFFTDRYFHFSWVSIQRGISGLHGQVSRAPRLIPFSIPIGKKITPIAPRPCYYLLLLVFKTCDHTYLRCAATHVWRPEVNTEVPPLDPAHLIFWNRVSD